MNNNDKTEQQKQYILASYLKLTNCLFLQFPLNIFGLLLTMNHKIHTANTCVRANCLLLCNCIITACIISKSYSV